VGAGSGGNGQAPAGTGVNGFSGDGGPATSAGNLLISDWGNGRIRMITG